MPSPVTILLVDDNPSDVALIREGFSSLGIAVQFMVAYNAPQAFRYLLTMNQQPPDLVILDLNLPIIRGHSILREFKAYPPWAGIPVFILSSSTQQADIDLALSLGASRYIVKPRLFDGYLDLARQAQVFFGGSASAPDPAPEPPHDHGMTGHARSATLISTQTVLEHVVARQLGWLGHRAVG